MTIQANFPNVQPSLLLDFANAKQLPPSVNFTRATNATYYDGSTTALAEQNLVLNSSLTGGTTNWAGATNVLTLNYGSIAAPDGTFTAIRCQPTLLSSYVEQNVGGFNVGGTKSIWARTVTGTANAVLMNYSGGDEQVCALTTTWQRFTVTVTNSTIYYYFFLFDARSSSHTATDFLIWAPQAENRSSATAYTATTTQQITNYIPVLLTAGGGQPRFDHNPTTSESLGLLVEEQRTNLYINSANFSGSGWSFDGTATITANTYVAPDGTLSADTLNCFANGDSTYQVVNLTNGATYTGSVYVKYVSGNTAFRIQVGGSSFPGGNLDVTINAQTGALVSNPGGLIYSVVSVGNGWYRFSVTRTAGASGNSFWDFNANAASQFALWGAQLEAGYLCTSYIPTTSAAATRAADFATMTGVNFNSWFNNGQGTLFAEQYITSVVSGSNNNQVAASLYRDSNNFIATGQGVGDGGGNGQRSSVWVQDNNSSQFFQFTGNFITVGLTLKNAAAYEANNFAYSANTQTLITDSAGTVPSVNTLGIGHYIVGSYYYANNPIRKIAFYPVRVTNAQLQALTS